MINEPNKCLTSQLRCNILYSIYTGYVEKMNEKIYKMFKRAYLKHPLVANNSYAKQYAPLLQSYPYYAFFYTFLNNGISIKTSKATSIEPSLILTLNLNSYPNPTVLTVVNILYFRGVVSEKSNEELFFIEKESRG